MKKIIATAALSVLLLGGCKKDLESINTDPKLYPTVPATALFTQAQRVLTNTVTSSNVNLNIFRLIEQQWTETTYTDESNYNLTNRTIPDRDWNAFYRDILNNLRLSAATIPTDITLTDADEKANDLLIIDILQVYSYYYLTTTFGNVPYTEANDPSNAFPKYDDAATIYANLIVRLNADITGLNTSAGSFGSGDLIYGGDVVKWKKFANTLKLKMGITIADSDPAAAKTIIESAVTGGVFTSNSDNATLVYQSATPNTNPIWVDLVQSGRNDFVAANTYIDQLKAYNDPRLTKFFTATTAGTYVGGIPGATNAYDSYSHVSPTITAPTFPGLLLDYAETQFNLAEAAERGFTVGGAAATFYNAAVTASINYWGGTAAEATAYLAQPTVNYLTAAGTYKQKIGIQKWFAFNNRGWDAWIDNRRLDFPALVAPATALSAFPVRFTYPTAEQNVNGASYSAASSAIGGDLVTTKLFFDKF